MHVGIANPRWRGKRSRHSRRMRNSLFHVSVKRPMWKICINQPYSAHILLYCKGNNGTIIKNIWSMGFYSNFLFVERKWSNTYQKFRYLYTYSPMFRHLTHGSEVIMIYKFVFVLMFVLNNTLILGIWCSTIPHLQGCFCPWTFLQNIGFNMVPSDPFMSHLATQLGYSAGEFQALQLIVLATFGLVN